MSEYVRQELLDGWIVAHDKYKARAEAAEKERDDLRAKLARVEALANQYEADYLAAPVEFFKDATQDIRAALADDTATGGEGS